jgi:hypothetical protein
VSIFSAGHGSNLGLRLESEKRQVDVLIVGRADRPVRIDLSLGPNRGPELPVGFAERIAASRT